MFCIDPSPTFKVPVKISRPGQSEPLSIAVTFRHKNKMQAAQWVLAAAKGDADNDSDSLLALLKEVISDWSGVIDEKGDQVPFDATSLATLLNNFTPARGELYQAYITELTVAKRKN